MFIASFKFEDFINKEVTIIMIIIQTQTKFSVFFIRINPNYFSGDPKLPSIPKSGPSLNIETLFLQLSEWDNELLSTPKIITFLAKSLPKLQESTVSNIIPYLLYTYFLLSVFFTILVFPNELIPKFELVCGVF